MKYVYIILSASIICFALWLSITAYGKAKYNEGVQAERAKASAVVIEESNKAKASIQKAMRNAKTMDDVAIDNGLRSLGILRDQ